MKNWNTIPIFRRTAVRSVLGSHTSTPSTIYGKPFKHDGCIYDDFGNPHVTYNSENPKQDGYIVEYYGCFKIEHPDGAITYIQYDDDDVDETPRKEIETRIEELEAENKRLSEDLQNIRMDREKFRKTLEENAKLHQIITGMNNISVELEQYLSAAGQLSYFVALIRQYKD